jgi:hypothetical protein
MRPVGRANGYSRTLTHAGSRSFPASCLTHVSLNAKSLRLGVPFAARGGSDSAVYFRPARSEQFGRFLTGGYT